MWLRVIIPGIVLNSKCKFDAYSARLAETIKLLLENGQALFILCAHVIAQFRRYWQ